MRQHRIIVPDVMTDLVLIGRSSSHFTRVARLFAAELGVAYRFQILSDILSVDERDYGENPALKIPVLVDERGPLFGTENVCRELALRSGKRDAAVLRGEIFERVVVNAEELVLHVMSAEVSLIVAKLTQTAAPEKAVRSIERSLDWLDGEIDAVCAALPAERAVSFVEVALFCTLRHLPFRDVMSVERWRRLCAFADAMGARQSAQQTEFRFDQPV